MNLSGECVKPFMDFYKVSAEKVLVIFDDMDVEIGKIRVRKQGSAGSHNGVKSVIYKLATKNFPRIRIGIGKPIEEYNAVDYVIGKLEEETYKQLEEGIEKAVEAVEIYLARGIEVAMSKCN